MGFGKPAAPRATSRTYVCLSSGQRLSCPHASPYGGMRPKVGGQTDPLTEWSGLSSLPSREWSRLFCSWRGPPGLPSRESSRLFPLVARAARPAEPRVISAFSGRGAGRQACRAESRLDFFRLQRLELRTQRRQRKLQRVDHLLNFCELRCAAHRFELSRGLHSRRRSEIRNRSL